jgi:DNA-binding CsgD family transcriptional regulator
LNHDRLLTTTSVRDTHALRQAIARAASDGSCDSQLFMLGGDGPEALHVRVRGLDQGRPVDGEADQRGRVLVALSDPNSHTSLPPELLGKLLGLSPAESRLASALCDGSTLNEYAAHVGVAISTARYQLKQVMAKTQVHTQAQLVQRLCSSVVFHLRN